MPDPAISFTERDYQTIREALINTIKARLANDWPEFVSTTIPMAILDIVSWSHSQSAYYCDIQAINTYLETAIFPEAIISLAAQLGYQRRLAMAASVSVTLYPNPPQTVPTTIRKGEPVLVEETKFEAADTYIIPSGKTSWPDDTTTDLIVFTEGETRSEEFTSNGQAHQTFALSQLSVLQGSLVVTVLDEEWEETESLILIEGSGEGNDTFPGTGADSQVYELSLLNVIINPDDENVLVVLVDNERWQLVADFTGAPNEFRATQDMDGITYVRFGLALDSSAPSDTSTIIVLYQISGKQKRFVVTYDKDGKATVWFGDGNHGLIPPNGAVINVEYRVGGGVIGNIRKGSMDQNIRGYLASGASINVRVYNHESGSGGEDTETLERTKLMAPRVSKAKGKAVTRNDWSALAMTYSSPVFGAPAFAVARLKQRKPERNAVEVIVWSRDVNGRITIPSTPLKQGIKSFLDTKRTFCTYVEMVDGDVLYFDIAADVTLKGGRTIPSLLDSIASNLRGYFNSTYAFPGIKLSLAQITQRIQDNQFIDTASLTAVQGSWLRTFDYGAGDGITAIYTDYFAIPSGMEIVPSSFEITDGLQTISDDGAGALVGDIDSSGTNTIDYVTGKYTATFADPPPTNYFVTAESRIYAYMEVIEQLTLLENRIDGITDFAPIVQREPVGIDDGLIIEATLPEIYLPYSHDRIFLIGGFDYDGAQPGGHLLAYDDGDGNILGDVASGGTINYDTGELLFTWNTTPPPISYTTYWGYLSAAPDGSTKSFSYEVRTASGGGGSRVSLDSLNGRGRLKFVLSDLTTSGATFYDGWDNSQGKVNSESLHTGEPNTIVYEDSGSGFAEGQLYFTIAPEVAAGRDFRIDIAPVTIFFYTAFTAFIEGASGYDKIIHMDNRGHLYGDVVDAYPIARVDFLCGRYEATLSSPSAIGRVMTITYDPFVLSDRKDIPISRLVMPTFSDVQLTEVSKESEL